MVILGTGSPLTSVTAKLFAPSWLGAWVAGPVSMGEMERGADWPSLRQVLGGRAGASSLSLEVPLEVSLYGCTERMH